MHYGDHILHFRLLDLLRIAVTLDCKVISLSSYYSVDDVVTGAVLEQHYSAPFDLTVLKSSQSHLVTPVHKEGIHTVTPHCDGRSTSFGNKTPYFLHHQSLICGFWVHAQFFGFF